MKAYNKNVHALLIEYQDEILEAGIQPKEINETTENYIGDPGCLVFDDPNHRLSHVLYMIQRMQDEAHEWTEGKVNRWLGFIQGVLWCTKRHRIIKLRDQSRELYSLRPRQRKLSWLERARVAMGKKKQ